MGVVRTRVRSARALPLVAAVVALCAACWSPPSSTPPPTTVPTGNDLAVLVGGTVADPQPGGKVVLKLDSPVDASHLDLSKVPASTLVEAALASYLGAAPLGAAAPSGSPLRTTTLEDLPLRTTSASVPLTSIGFVDQNTWPALLAGTPLAGTPIQQISLNQVVELSRATTAGGAPVYPTLAALSLGSIDLAASPLRTTSLSAFLLGQTTLGQLPATGQSPDAFTASWCPYLQSTLRVASCAATGLTANSTLFDVEVKAAPLRTTPLRTTPLRTTPLRTTDLSASPLRTTPLRTTNLDGTSLGQAPLRTTAAGCPSSGPSILPIAGTACLGDVTLASLPLRTTDTNGAPLRTTPLRTTPLRTTGGADPNVVVDCGRIDCSATSTATLGDAFDLSPSAIRPGVTVNQFLAAFPATSYVLADLLTYTVGSADVVLGDIAAALPDTVSVADAIAASIPVSALRWESVPLDELALPVAGATPAVAVTTRFSVTSDRNPAATKLVVELPQEVSYVPRNSLLVAQSGTPTYSSGVGAIEPAVSGTTLTFTIPPALPAGSYQLGFTATADRPFPTSLRFSTSGTNAAGDPHTTTATFPVVNGVSGQTYADRTVSDGQLFLGGILGSSDVDTFTVPVPASGGLTEVTLSHLGADLDLVGYDPSQRTPIRPFRSNGLKSQPLPATDVELAGYNQALNPQILQDLRLVDASTKVAGLSTQRGTATERITLISRPGDSGNYRFQVSGYNGATANEPFLVSVHQSDGPSAQSCVRPVATSPAPPAASTGSIGTATNVFLVDQQRLADTYGATATSTLVSKLNAVAAQVNGAVISVDGDPAVRAAYASWDAAGCEPTRANGVVSAIDSLVDSLNSAPASGPKWGNLASVTLVGGDDQIPQARIEDGSKSFNEAQYESEIRQSNGAATPLSAAAAAHDLLTDDPYVSWQPIAWGNSALYLPDVAIGRLVEKPSEISTALDGYLANLASPSVSTAMHGRLDASTALTTGYDFMADGAERVDANFAANPNVASHESLISAPGSPNPWSRSDVLSKVYGGSASPGLESLNAHFDHHELLPAGGQEGNPSTLVSTADVAGNPGRLAGRLIFSMGCHSGLAVPDGYLDGSLTEADQPGTGARLDWAEAFANDGAVYVGNTGYGYGDSSTTAFSELLMSQFATNLDGTQPVGQALVSAKQTYYGSLAVFSDYDQKVLMESTFYGLPFWGVGAPVAPGAPTTHPTSPDPATGNLASLATAAAPTITDTTTSAGHVITADGFAPTVADGQPITARTQIDATPADPNLAVHGFLITSLTSQDTLNSAVAIGRSTVDNVADEPAPPAPGQAFPASLQSTAVIRTARGTEQKVNLDVSQFLGDPTNPAGNVGTLRTYSAVGGEALYAPNSDGDGISPTISTAVGSTSGTSATFTVTARDLRPGNVAGNIVRATVMYRSTAPGSTWNSVDLSLLSSTGGIDTWSASPASTALNVEWFAQVVDASGNVSVTSDKGDGFQTQWVVNTIGGKAGQQGSTDGPGGFSRFGYPAGIATDAVGNLYVAELSNRVIRKISPAGVVSTLAGTAGQLGSADGTGPAARFLSPEAVAVDSAGNVFVTDAGTHTIRKITQAGVVTTFAGATGQSGSVDGSANAARFNAPIGIAADSSDNLYVADAVDQTIRKITPAGVVTTLAGSSLQQGSADGTGSAARFKSPYGVAADRSGNVFVSDQGNHTVRRITPAGVVTTLAGSAGQPGYPDGVGSAARFINPFYVATDPEGNVYVGDITATIRKITPAGVVTSIVGLSGNGGTSDGLGSGARLNNPNGIAVAPDGSIYFSEDQSHTIRKITPG